MDTRTLGRGQQWRSGRRRFGPVNSGPFRQAWKILVGFPVLSEVNPWKEILWKRNLLPLDTFVINVELLLKKFHKEIGSNVPTRNVIVSLQLGLIIVRRYYGKGKQIISDILGIAGKVSCGRPDFGFHRKESVGIRIFKVKIPPLNLPLTKGERIGLRKQHISRIFIT